MHLRNWQQKFIEDFPSVIKKYRRFIVKAPTGAGKTLLASEIIGRFYKGKKIMLRENADCQGTKLKTQNFP